VKFLIDNIWLIIVALLSGGALAWPTLTRSKNLLSTLQATQLLNKEKTQILDVRTPEEFSAGHLRLSKNIPLAALATRMAELDKNRALLVICQAGSRAQRAAKQLNQAGFTEVFVLEGGYTEWQAQSLPTTK
jgi:rhodanese-related sulfurtransferase